MTEAVKWEYRIEKMRMPADFQPGDDWSDLQKDHSVILEVLGFEGWDWFLTVGPLFYFKRPTVTPPEPSLSAWEFSEVIRRRDTPGFEGDS